MAEASKRGTDRGFVLWLVGGVFAAVLLFVAFGPKEDTLDPEPTTYNASAAGVKAAYLLLPQLGYGADRWTAPPTELGRLDAGRTTLVMTEPKLPFKNLELVQKSLQTFMERGGRVVATGRTGAALLPGGLTDAPSLLKGPCLAEGEGAGALGRPQQVKMEEEVRWSNEAPLYRVRQRCGKDAVVVSYPVGKGEAVWWSSPRPMTNQGLKDEPSLALLLASVGSPRGNRTVLFDEWLHAEHETVGSTLAGLPWWPLTWQCVAVAALLVLSFGRRNGPLRMPAGVPRTSPIEFAESMGRLYEKAGATSAATGAAESRLLRYLHESCGLTRETLRSGPAAIGEALEARFGGSWSGLERNLQAAQNASAGTVGTISAKGALRLVQALEEDRQTLAAAIGTHQGRAGRVQRTDGHG